MVVRGRRRRLCTKFAKRLSVSVHFLPRPKQTKFDVTPSLLFPPSLSSLRQDREGENERREGGW